MIAPDLQFGSFECNILIDGADIMKNNTPAHFIVKTFNKSGLNKLDYTIGSML